jgi:hypothetical protein
MNLVEAARKMTISKTAVTRAICLLVAVMTFGLLAAAAPLRYQMLLDDAYGYGAPLAEIGLSLRFFATYFTFFELLLAGGSWMVGVVIAWRKRGDWFALMTAVTLMLFGFLPPLVDGLIIANASWQTPIVFLRWLCLTGLMAVFSLFPNGRFVPHWLRFVLIGWIGNAIVINIFWPGILADTAVLPNTGSREDALWLLFGVAWFVPIVAAQLYRYKRVSTAVERQQTKWVIFGFTITVAFSLFSAILLTGIPGLRDDPAINTMAALTLGVVYLLSALLLPLTFAFAIFRYRLWQIDYILNRTLVYGGLTGLVTAVYLLMVGGLGLLAVGQQWRLLGIVLATAVTAILLKPVKNQLQIHVTRLIPLPRKADPTPAESVSHAPVPHERWLPWAQTAVACHILLSLVMFGAGTAVFYAFLTTPCTTDCAYFLQLQPAEVTALSSLGLTLKWYALFQISLEFLYLITFFLAGGVIYAKLVRQRGPQVWYGLLASFALISVGTILLAETSLSAASIGSGWQLLYKLLKASGNVAFLTFCLFFPDGRIIPHWVRWPVFATLLWMTAWVLLPLPALDPANAIGIYLSLAMLALIVSVQIYRYRRISGPLQRQQTKWLVFGFGIVFTAVFIWTILSVALPFPSGPERLLSNLIGQGILALFPVAFAACIAISLLRYRLWDIDILINRTLVYGGLTLSIVVIYTLIVGGLSAILHTRGSFGIALLATGFIAILFQPLRERLQRSVNRFMFGERDDPYKVLSKLGRQLGETAVPTQTLPAITATICQTLKLPYAAIELAAGDERQPAASSGERGTAVLQEWPLRYQGEIVGWLQAAPARRASRLPPKSSSFWATSPPRPGPPPTYCA